MLMLMYSINYRIVNFHFERYTESFLCCFKTSIFFSFFLQNIPHANNKRNVYRESDKRILYMCAMDGCFIVKIKIKTKNQKAKRESETQHSLEYLTRCVFGRYVSHNKMIVGIMNE